MLGGIVEEFVGAIHDGDGIGDVVEGCEKGNVFEDSVDACFTADLEKVLVVGVERIEAWLFDGRSADDVGALQAGGEFEPSAGFVKGEGVFPPGGFAPVADGDEAGDLEVVIGECFFDVGDFATAADMLVDFDGPEFDAFVSGFAGDADFVEEGGGFDGGGVQGEAHAFF